jgi:methionine sulfoxide reductase catalytic subunit
MHFFREIVRWMRQFSRMPSIIVRPDWHLPEGKITPEKVYLNRRHFLAQLGFTGAAVGSALRHSPWTLAREPEASIYPAPRNADFDPAWKLTREEIATTYNNFFEFTTTKNQVHRMVDRFTISPWELHIGGLVEKPMKLEVDELTSRFPLEERVYRFRCVEAWAMIVPWTGFELNKLLNEARPKPEAQFVRFESFNRPEQAPGMRNKNYPWPYTEGLRLDEAMHPLTMVVTGMYGKPLPKQNGAPVRVVVPWKYGYKSIKSIVKIDLVAEQPATLWETMAPHEYPFESNVNPEISHPRWSQATERMIDTGIRVKTQHYNGYGHLVAKLYP